MVFCVGVTDGEEGAIYFFTTWFTHSPHANPYWRKAARMRCLPIDVQVQAVVEGAPADAHGRAALPV